MKSNKMFWRSMDFFHRKNQSKDKQECHLETWWTLWRKILDLMRCFWVLKLRWKKNRSQGYQFANLHWSKDQGIGFLWRKAKGRVRRKFDGRGSNRARRRKYRVRRNSFRVWRRTKKVEKFHQQSSQLIEFWDRRTRKMKSQTTHLRLYWTDWRVKDQNEVKMNILIEFMLSFFNWFKLLFKQAK